MALTCMMGREAVFNRVIMLLTLASYAFFACPNVTSDGGIFIFLSGSAAVKVAAT